VFVTHDQAEALALADRMAVMEAGVIRQIGTPAEVFRRPANLFVASFIGSTPMNLLPGTIRGGSVAVCGVELPVPDEARARVRNEQEVVCGVRPEYMEFSTEPVDGALGGRVSVVENLGGSSLVTLDVDGESVRVVVGEGFEARFHAEGWALPRPDRMLLYHEGELVTGDGADRPASLAKDGGRG
jgi:multiple sugar transport system ATP-binding protein